MNRKMKFHIQVILGIILGVTGVFYLTGSLTEEETTIPAKIYQQIENTVLIEEASWALDCATSLERNVRSLKDSLQDASGERYDRLKEELSAAPPMPYRNNVIEALSLACNAQKSCKFLANWRNLGLEQYNSALCSRNPVLEVRYRCQTLGRYYTATATEGDELMLDCSGGSAEPQ